MLWLSQLREEGNGGCVRWFWEDELVGMVNGSGGDQNEEGDGVSGVHYTKWMY